MTSVSLNNTLTRILLTVVCAAVFVGSFTVTVSAQSDIVTGQEVTAEERTEAEANRDIGRSLLNGTTQTADSGCDWACKAGSWIGSLLLTAAALLTWAAGMLFDYSITKLVLEMGSLVNTGGVGLVINSIWGVVRDLVNVLFIFGFIYVGIRTILLSDDSFAKSFLAQLIVAALLINFSLFFVKVVIDVANVFALEVNELIVRDGTDGIGWAFVEQAGLPTLYDPLDAEELVASTANGSIAFYILGALFLLIAAFVLAAGAVMIIIRFIALLFIMIFSPLIFIGWIFPKLKSATGDLTGKLLSYAFFAPLFLFLLYISLRILSALQFPSSISMSKLIAAKNASDIPADGFMIVMQFTVAIIFLIASLKLAQTMSLAGGGQVVKFGNTIRGKAQGYMGRAAGSATFGTIGKVGRATIGSRAYAINEKAGLREAAAKRGMKGWAARRVLNASSTVADTSFDARRVGGVGKHLGLGEGKKGGFTTRLKTVQEKDAAFAKKLGEVDVKKDQSAKDWQTKVDGSKNRVQDLKDQIAATPNGSEEKKMLQGQLRAAEFELENYEQAVAYEKNRRQIGSAEQNKVMATMTPEERDAINTLYINLAQADAEEKAAMRKILEDKKAQVEKRLADEKEKLPISERGYAGTLENTKGLGRLSSYIRGRQPLQDKKSGEEVRKAYEKTFKKSKEDARTDKLVDTLKESSKKV